MTTATPSTVDVALIGAGIMSATTATLLKELEPTLTLEMFERLEDCALEKLGWLEQRRHRTRS